MPLKKGHSPEIVSANIKELVSSGYKPKQAIAIALANKRKYAKMAEGGMVDMDMDEEDEVPPDLYEFNLNSQPPENETNPDELAEHQMMASKLRDEAMMQGFAMGGLVEGESDSAVGNKPSEDMMDSSEEPMSSMPKKPEAMDHALMQAVEDKKRRRKMMGK